MVQVAVERGGLDGRFASPEKYAGYVVRDPLHKRIGDVQELFVNGGGEPEYVRVQLGVLGP